MNILVCIKQVPDTTEIRIDPITGTLIREGVPSIVNIYDTYALEAAARIKDEYPESSITVLSMGPDSAESALRDCLAVAADRAFLITGKEFSGADTIATSYTLSEAIRHIEKLDGRCFDAVFCGKQAIDGDTAQVGPEIAEHLDIPQVTGAVQVTVDENKLIITRETRLGSEIIAAKMPCLVTFTKPAYVPRLATFRRKMEARKATITRIAASEIHGLDVSSIGLKGSPTRVIKSSPANNKRKGVLHKGEDAEKSAVFIAEVLHDLEVI